MQSAGRRAAVELCSCNSTRRPPCDTRNQKRYLSRLTSFKTQYPKSRSIPPPRTTQLSLPMVITSSAWALIFNQTAVPTTVSLCRHVRARGFCFPASRLACISHAAHDAASGAWSLASWCCGRRRRREGSKFGEKPGLRSRHGPEVLFSTLLGVTPHHDATAVQ